MKYYRIKDTGEIAKGTGFRYWIYCNGEWVEDTENRINDMIVGYDTSEPEGSPYGFGSTSVMDEIESISYEEALGAIAAR